MGGWVGGWEGGWETNLGVSVVHEHVDDLGEDGHREADREVVEVSRQDGVGEGDGLFLLVLSSSSFSCGWFFGGERATTTASGLQGEKISVFGAAAGGGRATG